MSQRDYNNLPTDGETSLINVMVVVAAIFLLVGVVVVEYYLNNNYGVNFWNF